MNSVARAASCVHTYTQSTSEPRGSSNDAGACRKHIRVSRGPPRHGVRHSGWSHRGGHTHTGGLENTLYPKKVAAAGVCIHFATPSSRVQHGGTGNIVCRCHFDVNVFFSNCGDTGSVCRRIDSALLRVVVAAVLSVRNGLGMGVFRIVNASFSDPLERNLA